MPETNTKVLFKFGTRAQYDALASKLENALYFLTDTGELYRGSTAFGQAHVYDGLRGENETNQSVITRLVGLNVPANNDLVIVRNADSTVDIFMYLSLGWVQINSNVASAALTTQVNDLASDVADLDVLINGRAADPENNISEVIGLTDRVDNLETQLAAISGAFHFKGSVVDYAALLLINSPAEGDVYQVGDDEYAWNGTAWIKLGGQFDLSNYVTQQDLADEVADLQALIGAPATSTVDENTGETITTPASGIYADLASNADSIIPIFNGSVAGLVPVVTGDYTTAEKGQMFINGLGNWVTINTSAGQTSYTDENGNVYNTVEDYVTAMIAANNLEWEAI